MRGISQRLTKDLRVADRPKYRVEGIQGNEPNLEIDHAVPLNLIHDRILGLDPFEEPLDHQGIVELLLGHFRCVHLTRDQHRQLRANAMPRDGAWVGDCFEGLELHVGTIDPTVFGALLIEAAVAQVAVPKFNRSVVNALEPGDHTPTGMAAQRSIRLSHGRLSRGLAFHRMLQCRVFTDRTA